MTKLKMKNFWEELEAIVLRRNGAASHRIIAHMEQVGDPTFEDFIKANVGTPRIEPELDLKRQVQPQPQAAQTKKKVNLPVEEYKINTVKSGERVHATVKIISGSGWDFIDPRHLMKSTPDQVQDYLASLLEDRDTKIDLMADSRRRLLDTIIASWLAWAKLENMHAMAEAG